MTLIAVLAGDDLIGTGIPKRDGVGMHLSVSIEHHELVGVVGGACPDKSRHQGRLPRQAAAGRTIIRSMYPTAPP